MSTAQNYTYRRVASYDSPGGNLDKKEIEPGATLTVMDVKGPGEITHIWCTINAPDPNHLKALVLRMYWDDEQTPSVEAPIGDFFGLGTGEYFLWQSLPLQVGSMKALNSSWPMPYRKSARITVTNEGAQKVDAFYYNIDYREYRVAPAEDTLYFHAQYRQATPNKGWTNEWQFNWDKNVFDKPNPAGEGNYVFLDATGRGQFVGITMSVLQNQDGWWGEGDEMFFIDDNTKPAFIGTGSEDYLLGAWNFGVGPFSYGMYGAPVKGEEKAGARSSLYRFHLDTPIPFKRSLRATMEHGHANHRSDNWYSVAYWYQAEPHGKFPVLPKLADRIPAVKPTGGPGNAAALDAANRVGAVEPPR